MIMTSNIGSEFLIQGVTAEGEIKRMHGASCWVRCATTSRRSS